MKKTLLFIILKFFMLQNTIFATIQQITFLEVKRDTSGQKCVKISLQNGNIIYGTISKLDSNRLFFKQCNQPTAPIISIPVTDVMEITDAQGKIVLNKPQMNAAKKEKRGLFLAHLSLGFISISLLFRLLLLIIPGTYDFLSGGRSGIGDGYRLTPLGTSLVFVCMGALLFAVIGACISLNRLKNVKNKNARIKAFASIGSALSLLILYARSNILGD